LLLDLLGKTESLIKYVQDRPGHDMRYAIDHTKATRELDWEPKADFRTALESTIKWYQENDDWIQNIKSGEYLKYYEQQYGNRL
jgi:dTDP-glucose 4,6-dehydratase